MELDAAAPQRMPDFAGGAHAHHHSVHSALVSLEAMGISPHRITLRRAGRHALAAGLVIHQAPAAGEELTDETMITLHVAGLGFTHSLPAGLWDSGGEAAAGTREILEHLDDPLEKLRHWFHEGAPLFRIAPGDLPACARWLALFGVDAHQWPASLWYPLASAVAQLPQMACTEEGCRLLLQTLLDLPLCGTRYRACQETLPEAARSRLGQRASRLGVDLLLGDAVEDLAMLELEIGPVPLAVYERFAEQRDGRLLLGRVLELALPLSVTYEVRWTVDDLRGAPVLGEARRNARLGINTHMGAGSPASVAAPVLCAAEDRVWGQP